MPNKHSKKMRNRNSAIPYLLADEFKDTLAAGSVNGTHATRGTGTTAQKTRTVVDTTNALSIGTGLLTMTGPAIAFGDPGIWYGAFTRVAGRLLIVKNLNFSARNYVNIGFDLNQSGAIAGGEGLFYIDGSVMNVWQTVAMETVSNAVNYNFAVVLRAAGSYYFAKGGVFGSYWSLLWYAVLGDGAALYPAIANYNASFTIDSIRIPLKTWLPTPIAYDTFTRSNGVIGTSETSGPDSQTVTARTWTGTTWTIASNVALNTPTLGAELATGALTVGTWYIITATEVNHFYTGSAVGEVFRATATTALDASNKVKAYTIAELFASLSDSSTASVLAGVNIVGTANYQEGIVVNLDSATAPANFIIAYLDRNVSSGATRILLDECVAGVYTNKITVTNATYAASARLVVIRNGTACRVFYNNIAIGTVQTMTANTNTKHGLFSTVATNTFNDFLVMPRGVSGEYNALDRFLNG